MPYSNTIVLNIRGEKCPFLFLSHWLHYCKYYLLCILTSFWVLKAGWNTEKREKSKKSTEKDKFKVPCQSTSFCMFCWSTRHNIMSTVYLEINSWLCKVINSCVKPLPGGGIPPMIVECVEHENWIERVTQMDKKNYIKYIRLLFWIP